MRLSLCVGLAGCASQGPLHPPSLMLPAAVRGLAAQRSGNMVDLRWTNPTHTTDDVLLTGKHGAGSLTAEICRDEAMPKPDTPCKPIASQPAVSGTPAEFHDPLPAQLSQGPARPIYYRVRILNGKGKGATYTPILAPAGEAPAPMLQLAASPVAGGVAVHWVSAPASPGDRVLLRVERKPPATDHPAEKVTPDPHKKESESGKSDLLAIEEKTGDPGGAIDSGARYGVEQHYIVYRSRSIEIAGKPVVMNGASATVSVAASAQAPPPGPPTELEAVANTLGAPEIDLVWQASTEPGVVGYVVFRAEGDAAFAQLTSVPVHGFSYVDKSVRAGGRYRYRVASVNAQGAVGEHGGEVTESIPNP